MSLLILPFSVPSFKEIIMWGKSWEGGCSLRRRRGGPAPKDRGPPEESPDAKTNLSWGGEGYDGCAEEKLEHKLPHLVGNLLFPGALNAKSHYPAITMINTLGYSCKTTTMLFVFHMPSIYLGLFHDNMEFIFGKGYLPRPSIRADTEVLSRS